MSYGMISILRIGSLRSPPLSGAATKGGLHFFARQGGCMVFTAKGGIKNGAEGAVPPQRSDTI